MISYSDWQNLPAPEYKAPVRQEGMGLCLSGGGFKACLYHLGAIIRLNELELLTRLETISSVSGGAIAGAWLGCVWDDLERTSNGAAFTHSSLLKLYVKPVYDLITGHTLGDAAFLKGLLPFRQRTSELANGYGKHLFASKTLQDFPDGPDAPDFVITATCARTNLPWRFSKQTARCALVGTITKPAFSIADIVAGSSAFPLLLDPLTLDLDGASWDPESNGPFHEPPYTENAVLRDGGLVDNLGLDPVITANETILVSDAGAPFTIKANQRFAGFDFRRIAAALAAHGNDDRLKRLHEMAERKERKVLYWRLSQNPAHLPQGQQTQLDASHIHALVCAKMNLNRCPRGLAQDLVNHGYKMCALIFASYGARHDFPASQQQTLPFDRS